MVNYVKIFKKRLYIANPSTKCTTQKFLSCIRFLSFCFSLYAYTAAADGTIVVVPTTSNKVWENGCSKFSYWLGILYETDHIPKRHKTKKSYISIIK